VTEFVNHGLIFIKLIININEMIFYRVDVTYNY